MDLVQAKLWVFEGHPEFKLFEILEYAQLAQWLERTPDTREVAGSSPALGTIGDIAQLVEHVTVNHVVVGSSPTVPAKVNWS